MAKIEFVGGLTANVQISVGRFEVVSVEVWGDTAFVTAKDNQNTYDKVLLTIVRQGTTVEVGYRMVDRHIGLWNRGVFEIPAVDSVSEQVRKALQCL